MSEESRKPSESESEVEGHLAPQDPERLAHEAERFSMGAERTPHGRTPHGMTEEEGPEVEGHRLNSGPERAAQDRQRMSH